jgi:acetyl-CoA synthetase
VRKGADRLGDTSTLADPAVVDDVVEHRQNKKG